MHYNTKRRKGQGELQKKSPERAAATCKKARVFAKNLLTFTVKSVKLLKTATGGWTMAERRFGYAYGYYRYDRSGPL